MSLYEFSWVVQGEIAGMARPDGLRDDWEELRSRGVTALVNLTRRSWPEEELANAGLAYLHLPVPDMRVPEPWQIEEFLRFCDEQVGPDGGVAVHCLAGRGRTGTMLACYMVDRGMGGDEAIRFVRDRRPLSIETRAQEDAVRALAARRHED